MPRLSSSTTPVAPSPAPPLHGLPARRLVTIGVTGTDGKTTTVHLIASVLEAAGLSTGYLSSVAFKDRRSPQLNATHMTTVQSPEVQESLAKMLAHGHRYAVIEASSRSVSRRMRVRCRRLYRIFHRPSRFPRRPRRLHCREKAASSRCSTKASTRVSPRPAFSRSRLRNAPFSHQGEGRDLRGSTAPADLRAQNLHLEPPPSISRARSGKEPSTCRCQAATASPMPSLPRRSRSRRSV